MCGIFAHLSNQDISEPVSAVLVDEFNKIKNRGPDNHLYMLPSPKTFLGFHRLSINDLSSAGNQPFVLKSQSTGKSRVSLVCNGEIYNYKQLAEEHNITTSSDSDCEIIMHLYMKYGFQKTIEMLDGVFACILVDIDKRQTFVARDPIGVRTLYIGADNHGSYSICSELKGIHNLCDNVIQFPPGSVWDNHTKHYTKYDHVLARVLPMTLTQMENPHNLEKYKFHNNIETVKLNIKDKLINAVSKRLVSERQIGCLLSGGLDSSLIAAILAKLYHTQDHNKRLKTFSVGLKGAEDIKYARMVADFIDSDHTEVIVTEEEMLEAISTTIYQLETYDTTTIRAGTPMYLLSKYIKKNDPDDTTVIYTGEGSDEASGSYLYFHSAPNATEFYNETLRLMNDLCYFDVLRCDKSIAGAGLEARVPFLDLEFLEYYLRVDPNLKMPNRTEDKMEKYWLRAAFDDGTFLPYEVLWRIKEGMSDGVSSNDRGWFEIIQEHADTLYSDEQFHIEQKTYKWNPPMFKEALWFRDLFNQHFPSDLHDDRAHTIPYYWLPKWSGDVVDPSARVLHIYSE
jgi:asparagine synthase (glutamine-hydrolysing)